MHPTKHFSFLFLCFSISILLSACGSKGDLYQDIESEKPKEIAINEAQSSSEDSKKKQP